MDDCLTEGEVQDYLSKIPYLGVKAVLDNAVMPLVVQTAFYPYGSSFAGFSTSSEVCACFGEWL